MKSISEIITSFKNNLSNLGSPLASFTNYSNMYMIARAFAGVASQQYSDLDNYYLNSFLATATGDNLDARARDYNLIRAGGSFATGYVFATSATNITIPSGSILNSPNVNYQFQITQEVTVTSIGVYAPISSLINTELANLNAGTVLTSAFYPNVKFVIANSVDLNGAYLGGLQGGRSPETDVNFRARILSQVNNQTRGTLESVINKLNELNIAKFFIKESYPVTGYFTVFIDSLEQSLMDLVEENLMLVKPVGTAFEVKPIQSQFINLRFVVTLTSIEFAESVSNSIREICYNYFESLELGQELFPVNLAILCSNLQGIRDIRIVDPSANKVTAPKDTLLKISNIELSINSGG
jgi:uncharacterized phage protein gp47/JayE